MLLFNLFHCKMPHRPLILCVSLRIRFAGCDNVIVKDCHLAVRQIAVILEIHLDDLRYMPDRTLIQRQQIRLIQTRNAQFQFDSHLKPVVITHIKLLCTDQITAYETDIFRSWIDFICCAE